MTNDTAMTPAAVPVETAAATGVQFSDFQLNSKILSALTKGGYAVPTPVQAAAIPAVLQGRDVMACAQTGTGKTAAFVLPALHQIISGPSTSKGRGPRVLVLTPTRELAQQVADNIRKFSVDARIRSGVIVGGVSYGPQFRLLNEQLDLLVATPGRLIDHLTEGKVDFSRVEMVVLDEADRMVDMGFLKPVERILAAIEKVAPAGAKRPQMLLFSATFTKAVDKMGRDVLQAPARFELAPARSEHTQISQQALRADGPEHKLELLKALLKDGSVQQAIVFSATKSGADRLAKKLEQAGTKSAALHGGMKQNARKRTLDQLHKGQIQILVATDVAARGIDVKQLGHVINYDLPQVAEDYVHRIGRTGRGGETGVAISFVAPTDVPMLRDIEKLLGKKIQLDQLPGLEPQTELGEFERLGAAAPRSRQKSKSGGRGGQGGGARGGFRREPSGDRGGERGGERSFARQPREGRSFGSRDGQRSEGRNEGRSEGRSFAPRGESRNEGRREGGRSEGRSFAPRSERSGGGERSQGRSFGGRGDRQPKAQRPQRIG